VSNYRSKARKYAEEFGPEKAATILIRDARQDSELREHLVHLGAQQLVRNALTSGRSAVPASEVMLPSVAGRIARQRFMDSYTLFGGAMTLANATAKELGDSARAYDAQIAGLKKHADFQRAVGKLLRDTGKPVKDVLGEEKLKALAKEFKL
jgi:hypothetical protein